MLNLLSSALKFTNYGRLILTVEKKADLNSSLQFSVTDTGPGIAPGEIDSLFEVFVQTSVGIRAAEGIGIGLAISQRFAQMMGGEITIESVVGEGTTFHLTIQLAQSESSEVIMPSRQRVIGIKSGQLPSKSW